MGCDWNEWTSDLVHAISGRWGIDLRRYRLLLDLLERPVDRWRCRSMELAGW